MLEAITQDFVILPCDLVSDVDGLSLLEAWMVTQSGFGAATGGLTEDGRPIPLGSGGEKIGRRGGLGVWYSAARSEDGKKKIEESDFLATTPYGKSVVPPPEGSLRSRLEKVVMSMPMDTLTDVLEDETALPIRNSLLRKHGRVKMKTSLRDAHVYLFPYWVKDFMSKNETFDSLSEDVLGWWAKATWQDGLGDKLGLREVLDPPRHYHSNANGHANPLNEEISITALSTTSQYTPSTISNSDDAAHLASRVHHPSSTLHPDSKLTIPPVLAYIHPPTTTTSPTPQITRVDTTASLLTTSLRLAKLSPSSESLSPFAHTLKLAEPDSLPQRSHISEDSLIDAAVTLSPRITIKESVIGSRCSIASGARLTRCLLMEGVEVGEGVQMTGCIVGCDARIEGPLKGESEWGEAGGKKKRSQEKTVLEGCEIGHGYVVPWGTEAKGEKFVVGGVLDEAFEGGGEEDFEDEDVEEDELGESENEGMPVSER